MERVAFEDWKVSIRHCLSRKVGERDSGPAGIELVSQDRVAGVCHVDADLVRPARSGEAADEGIPLESLDDLVEGAGLLAAVAGKSDRHPLAVRGMGTDHPLDQVAVAAGDARDDRKILLADRPLLELSCEPRVGAVVLGDDQKTGGFPVKAVDDPGPVVAADRGKFIEVELECIDQRSRPVPFRRGG